MKKAAAAVVCCSDPRPLSASGSLSQLGCILSELGYEVIYSQLIFSKDEPGLTKRKAKELNDFYSRDEIGMIFDISGGDSAGGLLPYLDYKVISSSEKLFWGYSDLTTVINAINAQTGKSSVLWQAMNMVSAAGEVQARRFNDYIYGKNDDLFSFSYKFLRGDKASGVTMGGNIRCLLKLAGTPYFPDARGKLLVLESRSGSKRRIVSYTDQLSQMGVFESISGLLLGCFTEADAAGEDIESAFLERVPQGIPVIRTDEIGHSAYSKAISIGEKLYLER